MNFKEMLEARIEGYQRSADYFRTRPDKLEFTEKDV